MDTRYYINETLTGTLTFEVCSEMSSIASQTGVKEQNQAVHQGGTQVFVLLVKHVVRPGVSKQLKVWFVQLVQFSPFSNRNLGKPVRLPAGFRAVSGP